MKKTVKILIFALCMSFIYACTSDDYVFDENPTVRAANNRTEFANHLGTSNWVIELFPERDHNMGGISIYAEFNIKNNTVTLESEHGKYGKDSHYDVIVKNGSVLSFNNHNEGIHYYAKPSAFDYKGRYGNADFEFVYQGKEGANINTVGVKTRNKTLFYATNLSARQYLGEIKKMRKLFRDYNLWCNDYLIASFFSEKADNILVMKRPEEEERLILSFVFRPNGFRLYEPTDIDGYEIAEFRMNEQRNAFEGYDKNGKKVLENNEAAVKIKFKEKTKIQKRLFDFEFVNGKRNNKIWGYSSNGISRKFDHLMNMLNKKFEREFQKIKGDITFRSDGGLKDYVSAAGGYWGYFAYKYEIYMKDDKIYFGFPESHLGLSDEYGKIFLDKIKSMSPYSLTEIPSGDYYFIRVESTLDNAYWFMMF